MSFKVADGYVEVHGRHDRASTRRNAKQAVDDAEDVAKGREGSMLRWLFKTNPKLMRTLEAPIGSIFGSPVIFAAASVMAVGLVGLLSTAITTGLLAGVAGGFVAIGIMANKKALTGPWNKMTADIKGVFQRASQPIVQPLINAIGMISGAFKDMEPSFKRIYTAIAPLIEPFTGGILGFIQAMLPGIERAMPGIQTVVLALADHMPELGTAIGDFFATLAEHGPLLERVVGLMITWLENFFKVAGPILVFWMRGFAFWADAWNGLTDGIKKGIEWLTGAWEAIPGLWDKTWGAVKGFFTDLGTSIGTFFTDLGTKISTWWDDQSSSVSGWWDRTWGQISTWFSELPGRIGGFLLGLPGAIGSALQQAADTMFYWIGYMLGTAVNNVIQFPQRVWEVIQAGGQLWLSAITTALDLVINYIRDSWDRGIRFWSTVPGRVHDFMLDLGRRVLNAVVGMFTAVMGWWDRLPGEIWGAVQDAFNRAIGVFNWAFVELPRRMGDINNRIVAAIAGIGARLYNAGRDAIIGLVNGIQDVLGWAVDRAWDAARNIAQGFMDALHIGSPSKYMADKVGKWIPKGIMVGIEDNMGPLDDLAADFPGTFSPMARTLPSSSTTDSSTNYGGVQVIVHIDNLQELEDIKKFLDGNMRSDPKANAWAGNLYEQQGEYLRSYQ